MAAIVDPRFEAFMTILNTEGGIETNDELRKIYLTAIEKAGYLATGVQAAAEAPRAKSTYNLFYHQRNDELKAEIKVPQQRRDQILAEWKALNPTEKKAWKPNGAVAGDAPVEPANPAAKRLNAYNLYCAMCTPALKDGLPKDHPKVAGIYLKVIGQYWKETAKKDELRQKLWAAQAKTGIKAIPAGDEAQMAEDITQMVNLANQLISQVPVVPAEPVAAQPAVPEPEEPVVPAPEEPAVPAPEEPVVPAPAAAPVAVPVAPVQVKRCVKTTK
jgi:hypothetical protein